jgi:DNA-binding protein HU-beta
MPPAKGRSSEDNASQTTITLKQMAAELADGHNLSKKEVEALLDDLITLAMQHLRSGHRVVRIAAPQSRRRSWERGPMVQGSAAAAP